MAVLARLVERELDRIDTACLSAADSDRLEVLRNHDRVRADVLADAPGEHEVAPQLFAQLAARDFHSFTVVDVPVPVLDEQATEDALEVALAARKATPLAVAQNAGRLLPAQSLERAVVVVRCEQNVDEPLGQRLSETRRDRPIDRADHP